MGLLTKELIDDIDVLSDFGNRIPRVRREQNELTCRLPRIRAVPMELRKHRQVGAIPQVLRGEIPPHGSGVSQQASPSGNLDRKVAVHIGQARTSFRSDKVQVLKR